MLIVCDRLGVLATVELDGKFFFGAVEIEDVAPDGMLASEFCAGDPTIAQQFP